MTASAPGQPYPEEPEPPWVHDFWKECFTWGGGCAVIGGIEGGPLGAAGGFGAGFLAGGAAYFIGELFEKVY